MIKKETSDRKIKFDDLPFVVKVGSIYGCIMVILFIIAIVIYFIRQITYM